MLESPTQLNAAIVPSLIAGAGVFIVTVTIVTVTTNGIASNSLGFTVFPVSTGNKVLDGTTIYLMNDIPDECAYASEIRRHR
jgi:hypothetical protein